MYCMRLEAFALLNISSQLCAEHGIAADGSYEGRGLGCRDRKDVFFYQADEHRYVPRALVSYQTISHIAMIFNRAYRCSILSPE